MNCRFTALLFDLDGTLVDTAPQLTAALNRSLELNGLPPVEPAECRALIGAGVEGFVTQLTKDHSAQLKSQVLQDYQHIYTRDLLLGSELFPGVAALLDYISTQGVPLVVVTNKPQEQAERLVTHRCSRWVIREVIGAAPSRPLKPHPALARELETRGWHGRDYLFVGDTPIDIEFAHNAGFTSCAVTWGYRSKAQLLAMRPDYCVSSAAQLLTLLKPGLRHSTRTPRRELVDADRGNQT